MHAHASTVTRGGPHNRGPGHAPHAGSACQAGAPGNKEGKTSNSRKNGIEKKEDWSKNKKLILSSLESMKSSRSMLIALAVLACLPRRAAFCQAPISLVALVSRAVRALSRCLCAQHAPLSRAVPP